MKKHTKVDWPEAEAAFERNAPGLRSFIERSTGRVRALIEGDPRDAELSARVKEHAEEYVEIEPASSQEQYRWMEQFVAGVEPGELRDCLLVAIDGKGAFRRFKDVLLGYPVEREQWFAYRSGHVRSYINQWLEANDVETEPPVPWGDVEPPPEPEKPLVRPSTITDNPGDVLRAQVKGMVDALPAGELHAARVFLEYLRERGSTELDQKRGKLDVRRPYRKTQVASDVEETEDVETTPAPLTLAKS